MKEAAVPRVCIVKHEYYPGCIHVRKDAEALTKAGYEVDLICLRNLGEPPRENINGVQVYRLPVRHKRSGILRYLWEYGAFFVLAFVAITLLHLKHRYRAIEVDTMPDFMVFAALVPKLLGAKVILYLFECQPELFQWIFGLDSQHPMISLLRRVEVLAIKFADRCITCSESYRQVYLSHGADPDKFEIIPNVSDEWRFPPEAERQGVSEGRPGFRVVTHGTILERYGIQTILGAVAHLQGRIPGLKVQILGKGEYRKELERIVRDREIEEHVEFKGFVPHAEMVRSIAEADLGFVGIMFPYMSPNKMFEFVAMGVPVIAPSIPAVTDWFTSEEMAFFNPGDEKELAEQILGLYEDPKRLSIYAAKASQRYQNYRWNVSKHLYLGVYSQLIPDGAGRHQDEVTSAV